MILISVYDDLVYDLESARRAGGASYVSSRSLGTHLKLDRKQRQMLCARTERIRRPGEFDARKSACFYFCRRRRDLRQIDSCAARGRRVNENTRAGAELLASAEESRKTLCARVDKSSTHVRDDAATRAYLYPPPAPQVENFNSNSIMNHIPPCHFLCILLFAGNPIKNELIV